MKKPKYTMIRIEVTDYALLKKAKIMMERRPEFSRHPRLVLGWTIGALAEYYLLAKKRKII